MQLTVPVPAGMTPESLDVTVQLPVNVRSASVTVSQDNRVLAQVDLPPAGGPLVIPLDSVRVEGNSASLLVRSYLLPLEGYCLDPTNPLRLTNAAITYAGVERAAHHGGRLPAAGVAQNGDLRGQETIAVRVRRGGQARHVDHGLLRTTEPRDRRRAVGRPDRRAPPGNAPPLERHIVISEGPDTGVSLYGPGPMPALLISGSANDLTNQTRLLTSSVDDFALSSKAVAGPLKSTPQLPGNETTIRKLGQPGVNATALNPQVYIGLDQTRLGRSVQGVRVHLMGSYTPLPNTIGGQLVATIDGETIDRWPAEDNGVVDRWVDVPDRSSASLHRAGCAGEHLRQHRSLR